ncbi:MAG: hypothetical protein M3323_08330 [Actinomycetota bacterium]|nr:hypothetical protein [Actinomycetota bacterium]
MPAVILQHGLPGSRIDTLRIAKVFARAGVMTVSIDAPFARRPGGQETPVTFTGRDSREQIQLVVDLRRAVDPLVARGSEPKDVRWYAGGHDLGTVARCDATRWLGTRLRLSGAAFDGCEG